MSGVNGSDNVKAESDGAESWEVSDVDCSSILAVGLANHCAVSVERPAKARKVSDVVCGGRCVTEQPVAAVQQLSAETQRNFQSRQRRKKNREQKKNLFKTKRKLKRANPKPKLPDVLLLNSLLNEICRSESRWRLVQQTVKGPGGRIFVRLSFLYRFGSLKASRRQANFNSQS